MSLVDEESTRGFVMRKFIIEADKVCVIYKLKTLCYN